MGWVNQSQNLWTLTLALSQSWERELNTLELKGLSIFILTYPFPFDQAEVWVIYVELSAVTVWRLLTPWGCSPYGSCKKTHAQIKNLICHSSHRNQEYWGYPHAFYEDLIKGAFLKIGSVLTHNFSRVIYTRKYGSFSFVRAKKNS